MVSEFETLDELWLDAAEQVRDHGRTLDSRDGECREVLGYTARLQNPQANFMFNPLRKVSPSYAAAELLWYLSGEQKIDRILAYAPQYVRFAEPDGTAYGAYGHRWKSNYQIEDLIALLSRKASTRQAVVTMWSPYDLHEAETGKKDMPCTLNLNFIVRDSKLYLHAAMRSNDIWLGLPYDVWSFTCLQQLIAGNLGLELGWYQHSAMSMHCYERNMERFIAAAAPPSFSTGPMTYYPCNKDWHEMVPMAVMLEEHNRKFKTYANECDRLNRYSLIGQVLLMASTKWTQSKNVFDSFNNPIMKRYCEELHAAGS